MTEVRIKDHRRTIIRSLAVWLLIIVAEIVHGILRAIVLVPVVGEFRSNQIGVFTGSAIILAITYFTIRWIGADQSDGVAARGSDLVGVDRGVRGLVRSVRGGIVMEADCF